MMRRSPLNAMLPAHLALGSMIVACRSVRKKDCSYCDVQSGLLGVMRPWPPSVGSADIRHMPS